MTINFDVQLVPFGYIRLELGKSFSNVEASLQASSEEKIHYVVPRDTAFGMFDIQYEDGEIYYVTSPSTG